MDLYEFVSTHRCMQYYADISYKNFVEAVHDNKYDLPDVTYDDVSDIAGNLLLNIPFISALSIRDKDGKLKILKGGEDLQKVVSYFDGASAMLYGESVRYSELPDNVKRYVNCSKFHIIEICDMDSVNMEYIEKESNYV